MRNVLTSILVVLSIAAPRALAGDVAYQLETTTLVAGDETQESQSVTMTIKDREWAMPGVEESDEWIFNDRTGITSLPLLHVSSSELQLDRILWPRTRQMLSDWRDVKEIFSICIVAGP